MTRRWHCLPDLPFADGPLTLAAVQDGDIEPIRTWRNAQMAVLRQTAPISPEGQRSYFERAIWPTMAQARPANILLTIFWDGARIGYGGLVHVNWDHRRAEMSFLLAADLAGTPAETATYLPAFVTGLGLLAARDLGLRKLTTEAYAFRTGLMSCLEANGFRRVGVLRQHALVDGQPVDSVIHEKLLASAHAS